MPRWTSKKKFAKKCWHKEELWPLIGGHIVQYIKKKEKSPKSYNKTRSTCFQVRYAFLIGSAVRLISYGVNKKLSAIGFITKLRCFFLLLLLPVEVITQKHGNPFFPLHWLHNFTIIEAHFHKNSFHYERSMSDAILKLLIASKSFRTTSYDRDSW